MTTLDLPVEREPGIATRRARPPYGLCALIGLGGLFFGVTGPLLSTFVPPLVRDALGEQRTAIGAIMAIDNVLLLLLVPWAGPFSDRASARGRGRMPLVITGFLLASLGMAVLPTSGALGLPFLIAAIVLLHGGINVLRAPFHALAADLQPWLVTEARRER
jgi:MFS family permease